MKTFDVYALRAGSLDEARVAVERATGLSLRLHESGYRGGEYYRCGDVGSENFILQRNHYDESEDGGWAEAEAQDSPFVLYVSQTSRSQQLRTSLEAQPGVRLLRHTQI